MISDPSTSCHDFQRRIDGFLDGEIDAHSMRLLAMHASRCPDCAAGVERAENLTALLEGAVEREVARVDGGFLWKRIEADLAAPRKRRLVARALRSVASDAMSAFLRSPFVRRPALAVTGALAAFLLFALWSVRSGGRGATTDRLEVADNHAQIERIESSAPHVAVWSEPLQNTTAIWVASFEQ